jgi:2-methylcitrate dehydratase PrpD
MMDGTSYARELDSAYGHPKNPITEKDLTDKFRDCLSYSVKPVSQENTEKVIAMVRNLEDVKDVKEVISVLA